ncbi:MAG TPA: hypothetical protein VF221_22865 [Chloroflexota bacterium]
MVSLAGGRGLHARRRFYAATAAVLLALSIGVYSTVGAGLLRGSAGAAPQWQASGLSGQTVHYLALGHRDAGLLFAATETGVYRRDTGSGWTKVLAQPGVWSVQLLRNDRTVIAGDQSGKVDISTDAGRHWNAVKVASDAVYAVSTQPGSSRLIVAGAGGGLYRSVDGGARWQRSFSLRDSAGTALAWLPGSRRVVFAGVVASSQQGATEVFVSRDVGRTWQIYGKALHSGGGIMSLAVPSPGHLFAGTMGRAIWGVTGAEATWHRTAAGMPTGEDHVAGIATLPGHPGTLYAGTLGFGVFRTVDSGKHWMSVSHGLHSPSDAMIVLSLAYAPRRHILYAGTATGVYQLHLTAGTQGAPMPGPVY